jgi:hypothetical protein
MKINIRWILVRVGILSLLFLYGLLWLRMINSPSERTGTDFVGFFAAARIAQSQGPSWIYSPTSTAANRAGIGWISARPRSSFAL